MIEGSSGNGGTSVELLLESMREIELFRIGLGRDTIIEVTPEPIVLDDGFWCPMPNCKRRFEAVRGYKIHHKMIH